MIIINCCCFCKCASFYLFIVSFNTGMSNPCSIPSDDWMAMNNELKECLRNWSLLDARCFPDMALRGRGKP